GNAGAGPNASSTARRSREESSLRRPHIDSKIAAWLRSRSAPNALRLSTARSQIGLIDAGIVFIGSPPWWRSRARVGDAISALARLSCAPHSNDAGANALHRIWPNAG